MRDVPLAIWFAGLEGKSSLASLKINQLAAVVRSPFVLVAPEGQGQDVIQEQSSDADSTSAVLSDYRL